MNSPFSGRLAKSSHHSSLEQPIKAARNLIIKDRSRHRGLISFYFTPQSIVYIIKEKFHLFFAVHDITNYIVSEFINNAEHKFPFWSHIIYFFHFLFAVYRMRGFHCSFHFGDSFLIFLVCHFRGTSAVSRTVNNFCWVTGLLEQTIFPIRYFER